MKVRAIGKSAIYEAIQATWNRGEDRITSMMAPEPFVPGCECDYEPMDAESACCGGERCSKGHTPPHFTAGERSTVRQSTLYDPIVKHTPPTPKPVPVPEPGPPPEPEPLQPDCVPPLSPDDLNALCEAACVADPDCPSEGKCCVRSCIWNCDLDTLDFNCKTCAGVLDGGAPAEILGV